MSVFFFYMGHNRIAHFVVYKICINELMLVN